MQNGRIFFRPFFEVKCVGADAHIRPFNSSNCIASPIKPCQKMPLKIKFIKDDDERILPYCEEEDAEKFYFQQILTARFSWGSNKSGAM